MKFLSWLIFSGGLGGFVWHFVGPSVGLVFDFLVGRLFVILSNISAPFVGIHSEEKRKKLISTDKLICSTYKSFHYIVDELNENGWMLDKTLVEPTIRQITQQLFGRQFRVLRTQ